MGVLLKCEINMGAPAGNNQAQYPEVAADSTWAWMLPVGAKVSVSLRRKPYFSPQILSRPPTLPHHIIFGVIESLYIVNKHHCKVKVKVCAGSHQRALRKGSQLVLTLARAPPRTRKKRNNRDLWGSGGLSAMRSSLRLALLKPAALPVPPPIRSPDPPLSLLLFKVYFVSCFCNLVQAFYCMAVQLALQNK